MPETRSLGVPQYRFVPGRQFRFDRCWVAEKGLFDADADDEEDERDDFEDDPG